MDIQSSGKALKKVCLPAWLDYVAVSLSAFILSLQSSITVFSSSEPEVDSSVWLYIANRINYGEMPYLNSFDHKGPLLYIFEFLGLAISKQYGAWLIDFILLLVSFLLFYQILKLENNRLISLIVMMTAVCFLAEFYCSGNIVEIFAMPFITYACYVYSMFFVKGSVSNRTLVLFGIAFASVLLLRVDMVAPWCVICLFVCIDSIRKRKAKNLKRYIVCFLIGAAAVMIPVVIWLCVNHALGSCWDQYIVFNIGYSSFSDSPEHTETIIVFATFMKEELMLISWILSFIPAFRKKDIYSVSISLLLPIVAIVCSTSGRLYAHYVIPLIPLCVLAISHTVSSIGHAQKKRENISLIVSLTVFAFCGLFSICKYIANYYEPRVLDDDLVQTLNYIEEYSNENDPITVYGNRDSIYLLSDRYSASVYSYQYPIGYIDESVMDRYISDLEKTQPKLVILAFRDDWYIEYGEIFAYLKANDYRELDTPNGSIGVYVLE